VIAPAKTVNHDPIEYYLKQLEQESTDFFSSYYSFFVYVMQDTKVPTSLDNAQEIIS